MRKVAVVLASALAISGFAASGATAARNPAGTGEPGTAFNRCVLSDNDHVAQRLQQRRFRKRHEPLRQPRDHTRHNPHAVSEYDIAC